MFDDIPDILTAKECQQLLKIGKNSMLRYLKTGEIEGFKIGSRWRIYKFSVIEFFEEEVKKIGCCVHHNSLILCYPILFFSNLKTSSTGILQTRILGLKAFIFPCLISLTKVGRLSRNILQASLRVRNNFSVSTFFLLTSRHPLEFVIII